MIFGNLPFRGTKKDMQAKNALNALAERSAKYAAEQASKPKSKVEMLARAYCEELGYNPDQKVFIGMYSYIRWTGFAEEARAKLSGPAMDRALRRISSEGEK